MKGSDWVFAGIIAAVGFAMSGCALAGDGHTGPWDEGYVILQGDARGLKAFNEMYQGAITNGKAAPGEDTPYYRGLREREVEQTKREMIKRAEPSTWNKFWGTLTGAKPETQEAK